MTPRWHGPADLDAPDGDDALPADTDAEPTLRELAVGALAGAGFRVCRHWPLDRGAFLNEVSVTPARDADGYEVCVIGWPGTSKGSAVERHAGAFQAAREALATVGLYAHHEGGLRLEVGWQGTPEGELARMGQRRREAVAA